MGVSKWDIIRIALSVTIGMLIMMVFIIGAVVFLNISVLDAADFGTVPYTFLRIFFHNSKFLIFYLVPYVGLVHFVLSFLFIAIIVGFTIISQGFIFTVFRLIHLPLELFAFSLVIVLAHYRKVYRISFAKRSYLAFVLFSVVCLLLAAVIESFLR